MTENKVRRDLDTAQRQIVEALNDLQNAQGLDTLTVHMALGCVVGSVLASEHHTFDARAAVLAGLGQGAIDTADAIVEEVRAEQ